MNNRSVSGHRRSVLDATGAGLPPSTSGRWTNRVSGALACVASLMYTRAVLDLRYVSENLDAVRDGLSRRGFKDTELLEEIARLADERRGLITRVEEMRAERNAASQAMAKLDKKSEAFAAKRDALKQLGVEIKAAEAGQDEVVGRLRSLLLNLPNLPHSSVPEGRSEADNPVARIWGEKPSFAFEPKDHVDLGVALGILDFERAAKISGSRFVVLRGKGARLERALMQLMLDMHVDEHGATEVWTPALVKDSAMLGTGQLPKFANDSFRIAKDEEWAAEAGAEAQELYLVPTAEVSVTNLHAGEILEGAELPIFYAAYTPCFRSEAGSYGRDTRGMIRVHQFDKVELVRFCRPEDSLDELERLTGHAEAVLQRLGLHYRVVELCTGDLGAASQKTYDLEVWLPAQDAFREISSCSCCGDYQARRMSARFRREKGAKPELLHTLNGSGLAIGRTLVAILEQYQRPDGGVTIPEALRPYMGGAESL